MRGIRIWIVAVIMALAAAAWAASVRVQGTLQESPTAICAIYATDAGVSVMPQGASAAIRCSGPTVPGGVVRADGGIELTARANMAGPVAQMQVSADANQTVTVVERDKTGNVLYRASGLLRQPGGVITY